jgi:phosphate transport system ATP-binding protein
MNEAYDSRRQVGTVRVLGEDIHAPGVDLIALRRRVGLVFQEPNPFPKSIYDNVAFGCTVAGFRSKLEIDDRVEDALRRVGLWPEVKDDLTRSGLALSGGQRQRLCIARALAIEPEILLMDEPCSSLDPVAASRIEEMIHQLKDACTVVIVTHNMQQAGRVSDRTAFLFQGRLVEYDDTEKIFLNPERRETEAYLAGRFG